jgi:hypothetical protein
VGARALHIERATHTRSRAFYSVLMTEQERPVAVGVWCKLLLFQVPATSPIQHLGQLLILFSFVSDSSVK